MDLEIKQKDDKGEILENKKRLPDSKVIEEMNKIGLTKLSSKRKSYRVLDRLNNSPNYHKNQKKIKSNKTKFFK